MFNSKKPDLSDLPTTAQLVRSTIIAAAAALVLLITVVLPSEFGIDPTRIGSLLGLTEMGEIKEQLHQEADEERKAEEQKQSSVLDSLMGLIISTAHAQEKPFEVRDTVSITLTPGKGAEVKLVMKEGEVAFYRWTAGGSKLNYDLHGDTKGRLIQYEKGRGVPGDEGKLVAAFNGDHGWFWRNRTKSDVTMTLEVGGKYEKLKRIK